MRTKKLLTIATGIVVIISIIIIIVYRKCNNNIYYDMSLAIFGSALLGMIVSVIEYFSERRNSMEMFWQEARKTLFILKKAKPITTREPKNIIIECLGEKASNELFKENEPQAKILGLKQSDEALNKYIEWLKKNNPLPADFPEQEKYKMFKEMAISNIDKYIKQFKGLIDVYIELSKIDLEKLNSSYAGLDFLFGNCTIRKMAYEEIYHKIHHFVSEIRKETIHFELWKQGKGNFVICCDKLYSLDEKIFKHEIINDEIAYKCIYQTAFYNIEKRLEEFRCKIYFKAEKQEIDNMPVYGEATEEDKNV